MPMAAPCGPRAHAAQKSSSRCFVSLKHSKTKKHKMKIIKTTVCSESLLSADSSAG